MPKKTTNASLPKKSCDFFFCPEKKISAFFLPPQNSQIRTTCKLGGHDLWDKIIIFGFGEKILFTNLLNCNLHVSQISRIIFFLCLGFRWIGPLFVWVGRSWLFAPKTSNLTGNGNGETLFMLIKFGAFSFFLCLFSFSDFQRKKVGGKYLALRNDVCFEGNGGNTQDEKHEGERDEELICDDDDKCAFEKGREEFIFIEYHILFSEVYSCPVLYFQPRFQGSPSFGFLILPFLSPRSLTPFSFLKTDTL